MTTQAKPTDAGRRRSQLSGSQLCGSQLSGTRLYGVQFVAELRLAKGSHFGQRESSRPLKPAIGKPGRVLSRLACGTDPGYGNSSGLDRLKRVEFRFGSFVRLRAVW